MWRARAPSLVPTSTDRSSLVLDARRAARTVSLRHVHDDEPGFSRRRHGRGYVYRDANGARVTDRGALARITTLAIPPAWTSVWICATDDGHVQATGRDARGRKQYRYHARFRAVREEAKFDQLLAYGASLPALRARIDEDLERPSLGRSKVVAAIVRIMERTCIRVGNTSYANDNGSFGITTLAVRHAHFGRGLVSFSFIGKSHVPHQVELRDVPLASIVKRCRDLPGQRLFQWIDETGAVHPVTSSDVNDYIRDATDGPFTAKLIRTWAATVGVCERLLSAPPAIGKKALASTLKAAITDVAAELGNTPTVCRKSYVHPAVVAAHEAGTLRGELRGRKPGGDHLRPTERALLSFLSRSASMRPLAKAS